MSGGTSSVTVRFHKDLEMAAVLVTEDYLAKHIRKRPLYSRIPQRPPMPESAFVSSADRSGPC